tara:strand:- start:7977 stop:8780 length:804 start_codon:yes stop_codon:yes gene_type:complete
MKTAFLCSKKIYRNRKQIKMLSNPLPGVEIGIPLILTQNIFTNLHYDYDITTVNNIFTQFCLGYFCYGTDRFLDSLDNKVDIIDRKKILYDYYDKNRPTIMISLLLSYLYLLYVFQSQNETIPFEILLTSTLLYKPFKQNYGEFKAFYLALLWTTASVIIPCVTHDHNYEIFKYPLDYLPCFFSIYGGTTIGDMLDIEEDKSNNITTIPVRFGSKKAYTLVLFSITLSNFLITLNPNFSHRFFINSLFEIQNTGTLLIPFFQNISLT